VTQKVSNIYIRGSFFMRIFRLLTIGITAAAFAACSSPGTKTANTTVQNTANQAAPANQAATQTQPTGASLSPTETLKALNQASSKKDAEGIKRYLSSGTLDRLEHGAKEQNLTVEQIFKEEAPFSVLPETRGESIEGDTATVEILNPETKEFEKLPFVKENGQWKVALDKYIDSLIAAGEEGTPDDAEGQPEPPSNRKQR
jgi:hypothetical protein